MMQWHVKLPQGKQLWLESDTPHEDLEKLGYDAFALTDIRCIPRRELPRQIKWIRACARQADKSKFWEVREMYELWVNMADGGPWRQFFYEERDTRKLAEKIKEVLRDGGTVQLREC